MPGDIFCKRELTFRPLFFWFKEDNSRWSQISEGSSFTTQLSISRCPLPPNTLHSTLPSVGPCAAPFDVFLSEIHAFKINSKRMLDRHRSSRSSNSTYIVHELFILVHFS